MADVVEDIKGRLGIYDVVSKYVQLKKAGQNYKGLCPFHGEKSPSFVVSPEKQICHCFGCGKGGDIFTFVQEVEGVSFSEALRILADSCGIKVEESVGKGFASKDVKDEYFKAHDLAAEYFKEQLFKTNDGKKVLEYLYKRGVNDATIDEFKIGFAPDVYDGLYPLLLKKGISKEVIIKSGLASAKNLASDDIYDKYRMRLIFPIFNYFGQICGFGGRALKQDQMPKYLNSPENLVYNKSKVLYGLSHAKSTIKDDGRVLLVEGYFDVILPYQNGVKNVVATSGTALTADHVRLLSRLTTRAVTCFDMDNAGFEATVRAYSLMSEKDISVKSMVLSDGKDPADFFKEHGKEDFLKIMNGAENFLSFYMTKLIEKNDISDVAGRRLVLSELMPLLKPLSAADKDYYLGELAVKVGVNKDYLYDELSNFKLPENHPARSSGSQVSEVGFKMTPRELLIAVCLYNFSVFGTVSKRLNEDYFSDDLKSIYKALEGQYNSSRSLEKWDFDSMFSEDLKKRVNVLYLYAEDSYGGFNSVTLETEVIQLIALIDRESKESRISDLRRQIQVAENNKDTEKLQGLLLQLIEMTSKK
ncbi:DNA primase [Candidatus Peregrinibacteria bacterium CG10_big_fil_rev_8_21_14_0_10_36_19]|nr:MAG: DNA primase [Candidatus Peregrinibacteria bacterium CG10_big_fil_rev_8_21_14_0_10_36_19]